MYQEKHGTYWFISALLHQAVLQERATAICRCGIRRKRCNVSSRRKVPKWNLPFCFRQSMTRASWSSGTSRPPSHWSTKIDAIASNDRSTLLTTLSLAIKNVGGLSANQRRSYSSRPNSAPIAISLRTAGGGALLAGRLLPPMG